MRNVSFSCAPDLFSAGEHGRDQLLVVGEWGVEGCKHARHRLPEWPAGERDYLIGAGVVDRCADPPR